VDVEELRRQGLIAPGNHEQRIVDQYRAIKRPLLNNADSTHEPQVDNGNLMMIASAFSGEGKTFTCLNLCLSIARERDWSVLLVDGDNLKPDLTRLFGAEGEQGLMDLLREPNIKAESLVMPTDIPNFALLPAGKADRQASELFASARMAALCAELSQSDHRRVVIFDSAPLLLTSESPVLATRVGQVVLVVQANRTPRKAVLEARDRLDTSKAISLVLNQSDGGETFVTYGEYGNFEK
jgi:exopolysaccharide/PEP-CTERM locus tyrosine autokinase